MTLLRTSLAGLIVASLLSGCGSVTTPEAQEEPSKAEFEKYAAGYLQRMDAAYKAENPDAASATSAIQSIAVTGEHPRIYTLYSVRAAAAGAAASSSQPSNSSRIEVSRFIFDPAASPDADGYRFRLFQ